MGYLNFCSKFVSLTNSLRGLVIAAATTTAMFKIRSKTIIAGVEKIKPSPGNSTLPPPRSHANKARSVTKDKTTAIKIKIDEMIFILIVKLLAISRDLSVVS
ncbi:MAG: hypothetical protein ACR2HG_03150 [Pyrinomonadaceae bacterium]